MIGNYPSKPGFCRLVGDTIQPTYILHTFYFNLFSLCYITFILPAHSVMALSPIIAVDNDAMVMMMMAMMIGHYHSKTGLQMSRGEGGVSIYHRSGASTLRVPKKLRQKMRRVAKPALWERTDMQRKYQKKFDANKKERDGKSH